MKKNKLIWLIVLVVVVLLGVGAVIFWGKGIQDNLDQKKFEQLLQGKPDLLSKLEVVLTAEKNLTANEQEAGKYIDIGLKWKTIGELSNQNVFFEKSLAIFERGIKKVGQKNILFYLDAGKIAERLGDFSKAENYYNNAIEIGPNYNDGYLALAELYQLKMKKTTDEIIKVYDDGLKNVVRDGQLTLEKASYLRKVGKNKEALDLYKELSAGYPTNQGFKDVIKQLETLVK